MAVRMNFFKLYIGDYQRDTAHLSVTEHGAYLLMLQHYYATEKPLPTGKALHRMLRAQDRAEREAIDAIASQFWRTTDAGLVNDRADAEIAKACQQAETNRAIAQEREAKRKVARTRNEPSTNRATNDQPNQTPDTRHQTQTEDGERAPPPGDDFNPEGNAPTAAGLACRAIRMAGIPDVNPSHPDLQRLLAAGITAQELADTAAVIVGKGKASFAYLLRAVEGQRRDAAEKAQIPPAPSITVPSNEAAKSAAYLASQRLTPEQRAASDAALAAVRQRLSTVSASIRTGT
ncbi:MAG: hypothetical protein RLZZ373_2632 [Pseudomonadota bacterium]|jgi:uncharacterized protein YdaU (DUF1376 family)